MSRSKPLAYQSAKTVLEYISFEKRKHFYAVCPAIRKMEEILPYHLELVELCSLQDDILMIIDSFRFCFGEWEENQMRMINLSTNDRVDRLTRLGPEQAAEKFLLFHLSREGARIKNVDLIDAPEFISKCIPIAIKDLDVFRTAFPARFPTNIPIENVEVDTILREDFLKMAKHITIPVHVKERINTEIISEWNCESIQIEARMKSEDVADYCNKVSKRSDRPIGSRLMARHSLPMELFDVLDILHSEMYARKTMLDGRECATISIDESTELNVYGCNVDDHYVVVEVCARGTAIDRAV